MSGRNLGARIEINNVSVTYKTGDGLKKAIKDITLTLHANEFVSIVGPSGCGKTTMLRVVAGLIMPSQGEVTLNRQQIGETSNRQAIGYVFQDAALLEWRTVSENITLPLELAGAPRSDAQDRALELIELVDLKGFEKNYPHELSGGMRQRVSIARALSCFPQLLLMDEPFAALDELTREKMNSELLRIWEKAKSTVIFVTHNLFEAAYLADRVIVLSQRPGHIIGDVPIPFQRPRNESIRDDKIFHQIIAEIRSLFSTREKTSNAWR